MFTNCTFEGNYASHFGGAVAISGPTTMVNCVLRSNWAVESGSAVSAAYSLPLVMINCTVAYNVIEGWGSAVSGQEVTATNCILWGNNDSEGSDLNSQISTNATTSYCCIQGLETSPASTGNIGGDPLLDDDLRLSPGSPCIDAADNTAVPPGVTTDLAGNPRFVDDPDTFDTGVGPPPIVDMGAYEFQIPCPADLTGDGAVGPADLAIVLGSWGPAKPDDPADLTGDGFVNSADLAILLGNWGDCP